jgi:hypothetical protein
MAQNTSRLGSKEIYEPPQLTAISLRPEEAVLGHCKSTTSGGPAASTCFPFCGSSVGS